MIRKCILLLLVTIPILGCNSAILKMKGVKTRVHFISQEKITEFALRHHFDTTDLFYNNAKVISFLQRVDKSPNVFLIFNKQGNLVVDTISGTCKGLRQRNLFSVLKDQRYRTDSIVKLNDLKSELQKENPTKELNTTSFDYTVILSWATYAGKLNKTNYTEIKKEIERITDPKIKLVSINLDFIEGKKYFKNQKDNN